MSAPPRRTNGSVAAPEAHRWPRSEPDVDLTEACKAAAVPQGLEWQVSYDRASIERFLGEVAKERARLHREIEVTKARLEEARAANVVRAATVQAEVAALVLAAQEELAAIERHHQAVLQTIRSAAIEEAARLMAAARAEAEELRNVATSVSARLNRPYDPTATMSEDPGRVLPADARSDAR